LDLEAVCGFKKAKGYDRMHNNEGYYSFLKTENIPGGGELYERVLNAEKLFSCGVLTKMN